MKAATYSGVDNPSTCRARRVARRGESCDDRLCVGDKLPVERPDQCAVDDWSVPGVPVGVTHHHVVGISMSEDLVSGSLPVRIEPFETAWGQSEVDDRVVGNRPRTCLVMAPRWPGRSGSPRSNPM